MVSRTFGSHTNFEALPILQGPYMRASTNLWLYMQSRKTYANAHSENIQSKLTLPDLAQAILYKLIPMLIMHFEWEFEDSDAERIRETMFGVRWRGANIKWKERSTTDQVLW
jgi:hypothetical protein